MNVSQLALAALGIYGVSYLMKNQSIKLRYFSPSEFGIWWPLMNPDLLYTIDEYRHILGRPVSVSPAIGSLGRPESPGSQHFPNPLVNAADLMSDASMTEMYDAARQAGFTGIGLYPEWLPKPGIHGDVRPDRTHDNPAQWSAIKTASGQEYVDIERALT